MNIPEGVKTYLYVVYEHPRDYPEEYVIRLHCLCCGKTVPGALVRRRPHAGKRAARLPPGVENVGRFPGDDPVIKEVWL